MDNLKETTLKSFAWFGTSKFVGQIISYVVTIYVARILSPDDYGLMGIALLVIIFSMLFTELGFGAAIIQKTDIDQQILSGIFWFSLLASAGLSVTVYFSAPTIGYFFNSTDVVPIIEILSISFFAGTINIIPYNLLTRELQFDKRSKAEFVTTLLTSLLTLYLAINGFGVYSLVYSYLFRLFFLDVLIFYYHPWYPTFVFPFKTTKDAIWFGLRITGYRTLIYFINHSDSFVAGKYLGMTMLGYYTMAFNLARMPADKISATINEVSFPVLSKLKNDIYSFKQYFNKISTFTAMITFPIFTIGILLAEDLFIVILTEKWKLAIVPFKILCFIGAIQSVIAIFGKAFEALGELNYVFRFTVVSFFVLPTSFYIGSSYGVEGIALAWLFTFPILSLFLMNRLFNIIDMSWVDFFKVLETPLKGSLLIVFVITILNYVDPFSNRAIRLIFYIMASLTVYFVFVIKTTEGNKIKNNIMELIKVGKSSLNKQYLK